MSRMLTISKGYGTQSHKKSARSIQVGDYFNVHNYETEIEGKTKSIKRVLSPEVDIFSSLPMEIFANDHVKLFLEEMRRCILEWDKDDLSGIVFPKLQLTEFTDVTIVIEWIFNYFRLYFSFDEKEGDFYGEVMSDSENGKFHNDFRKMEVDEFPLVAEAEVAYAVLMAEGGE